MSIIHLLSVYETGTECSQNSGVVVYNLMETNREDVPSRRAAHVHQSSYGWNRLRD